MCKIDCGLQNTFPPENLFFTFETQVGECVCVPNREIPSRKQICLSLYRCLEVLKMAALKSFLIVTH